VMRLKKPKALGLALGLKRTRSPGLNVCGIIRPHSVDVRELASRRRESLLWTEGGNRSSSPSVRLVQSDGGSAPASPGTIAGSRLLCSRARAVPRAEHPSPRSLILRPHRGLPPHGAPFGSTPGGVLLFSAVLAHCCWKARRHWIAPTFGALSAVGLFQSDRSLCHGTGSQNTTASG
jgi:hypothetical protein